MPAHRGGCSISKKPALACNEKKMLCCPTQPTGWQWVRSRGSSWPERTRDCRWLQWAGAGSCWPGSTEQGLAHSCSFNPGSSLSSSRRCCTSPTASPCSCAMLLRRKPFPKLGTPQMSPPGDGAEQLTQTSPALVTLHTTDKVSDSCTQMK